MCLILWQVKKEGENPVGNTWIFACSQDMFDERPYYSLQNGGQGHARKNMAPLPNSTPGIIFTKLRL